MATNTFRSKTFEDFTVLDENDNVVGHIRVKPNGIAWCSAGKHKWRQITLAQFRMTVRKIGKTLEK